MSDREALGDGEDARVTTDGDLACLSIVNIDANRDLELCASQLGISWSCAVREPRSGRGSSENLGLLKKAGIGNVPTKKSELSVGPIKSQKGARPRRLVEGEGNRGEKS